MTNRFRAHSPVDGQPAIANGDHFARSTVAPQERVLAPALEPEQAQPLARELGQRLAPAWVLEQLPVLEQVPV